VALVDEPGQPVHQHPGLSASRAGQDQHRALAELHRLQLPLVQFHDEARDRAARPVGGQPACGARGAPATDSSMARYDRKDATYREARERGFRSRAAIKLEDIDAKFHLLTPGARVVDLGAWPGGWLEVAAARVGAGGRIVGVDLVAIDPLPQSQVTLIEGDAADPAVLAAVAAALGGPADLVLSDMAPKLSGIRAADDARHEALVECAVAAATRLLADDGALVLKLFSRVESQAAALLRREFRSVARHRPGSTRKGSAEIYAVARSPRRSG
jgi:23S rRNA (uridine2552-2'-O)-methyltransferase